MGSDLINTVDSGKDEQYISMATDTTPSAKCHWTHQGWPYCILQYRFNAA